MRNFMRFGIFIVSMFCLFASNGQQAFAQETSATKEETMTWLKTKLNGLNSSVKFSYVLQHRSGDPDLSSASTGSWRYSYSVDSVKDCTITWIESSEFDGDGDVNKMAVIVNLSDLDPYGTTVEAYKPQIGPHPYKLTQEAWWLTLNTTEAKPKIKFTTDGKTFTGGGAARILFGNQELAKRFAKALEHGSTLCGGKVEPF